MWGILVSRRLFNEKQYGRKTVLSQRDRVALGFRLALGYLALMQTSFGSSNTCIRSIWCGSQTCMCENRGATPWVCSCIQSRCGEALYWGCENLLCWLASMRVDANSCGCARLWILLRFLAFGGTYGCVGTLVLICGLAV